jgi:hypothetical protein
LTLLNLRFPQVVEVMDHTIVLLNLSQYISSRQFPRSNFPQSAFFFTWIALSSGDPYLRLLPKWSGSKSSKCAPWNGLIHFKDRPFFQEAWKFDCLHPIFGHHYINFP